MAFGELKSVFERMDKVLPGRDRPLVSRLTPAEGWGWRSMVIEAKPVSVGLLESEDWSGWRFEGVIPELYQNTLGRRWYITEQTRCPPRDGEAAIQGLSGVGMPSGCSLWHAPDDARRLLCLARHDGQRLLDALPGLSLPVHEERGVLTLFATPGPAGELCLGDCLRLLRPHAPYVARLVEEYGRGLCWMFGLSGPEIEEDCRLHLAWCGEAGKPLELPPASPCRYENGPVVRVGLGPPVVEHDLAPTIRDPSGGCEWPVRVGVPEGAMLCLDGASRMRYAHAHPPRQTPRWLSFTFMLDCNRRSTAVGYERETRAVVMQTPVLPERVVRTRPPASEGSADRGDAVTHLVRSMRRRLRIAESHLLAAKYLPPAQRAGSAAESKSSSSSVLA